MRSIGWQTRNKQPITTLFGDRKLSGKSMRFMICRLYIFFTLKYHLTLQVTNSILVYQAILKVMEDLFMQTFLFMYSLRTRKFHMVFKNPLLFFIRLNLIWCSHTVSPRNFVGTFYFFYVENCDYVICKQIPDRFTPLIIKTAVGRLLQRILSVRGFKDRSENHNERTRHNIGIFEVYTMCYVLSIVLPPVPYRTAFFTPNTHGG